MRNISIQTNKPPRESQTMTDETITKVAKAFSPADLKRMYAKGTISWVTAEPEPAARNGYAKLVEGGSGIFRLHLRTADDPASVWFETEHMCGGEVEPVI